MIIKARVPHYVTHRPKEWQTWRLKIYHFVNSNYFEVGIIIAILLNMS